MLDIQLLRTNIDAVGERLASRGYTLDTATFQALESEQERADHLDVEFDQLQLELSTWATSPRIEKIAREDLGYDDED